MFNKILIPLISLQMLTLGVFANNNENSSFNESGERKTDKNIRREDRIPEKTISSDIDIFSNPEAKPAARWWWLGSAVDEKNITANMEEYAAKGMGALEITPIYGVTGNDENDISFLSDRWMEILKHTIAEGKRLGINIDMNAGTGWPFGGPEVTIEDAASKLVLQDYRIDKGGMVNLVLEPENKKDQKNITLERVMAFSSKGKTVDLTDKIKYEKQDDKILPVLKWKAPKGEWQVIASFCGKTGQKVKRAAPGGEGFVMDHFSTKAVSNYFDRFDKAFEKSGCEFPHNFFNDSYEVYGANWTPGFYDEFKKRKGYDLAYYLPVLLEQGMDDHSRRVISDYREVVAELILANFTHRFTDWAEKHGSKTRNQAHGSPGNLIDLYATVSVPECESFGISDFNIKGLRVDSLKKVNDSDLTMLKYASSGAHLSGKNIVTSETFTWLTEHFRTSLAQCKPDLDLFFLSGVNHTFFHGTTYSPLEAEWPGWMFYASVNMSPTNSIWRDAKPFFEYITRCQGYLQSGKPDNDYLVYMPIYDIWHEQDGLLLLFDIHKMQKRAPEFISAVDNILNAGYDVDYISDNFIRGCKVEDGEIVTSSGAKYKALIIPGAKMMPHDVLEHINDMIAEGATVAFINNYPEEVPGFATYEARKKTFSKELSKLPVSDFSMNLKQRKGKGNVLTGTDYEVILDQAGGKKELMKSKYNLGYIRRKTDRGYTYFISCLQGNDVKEWIPFGVTGKRVMFIDPLTGYQGLAKTRMNGDVQEVLVDLKSGQSLIVSSTDVPNRYHADWKYLKEDADKKELINGWKLSFIESTPAIDGVFDIDTLSYWTNLDIDAAKVNMGTALYTNEFDFAKGDKEYILQLDNVRESARVRINGKDVVTLWSVPYECNITNYLVDGKNLLELEVTNLPANRIADYDRRNIQWRKFKEINHVDLNYKKTGYGHWDVVESGLQDGVRIVSFTKE